MIEPQQCGRPNCRPVFIELQQFVRCLHCGAASGTDTEHKAIALWNAEMDCAKGKTPRKLS